MRQNLYTCCRCGLEERTAIEVDEAPPGWAIVTYQRIAMPEEDQEAEVPIVTHACADCAVDVLVFLKKDSGKDVDHAFDDGGDA